MKIGDGVKYNDCLSNKIFLISRISYVGKRVIRLKDGKSLNIKNDNFEILNELEYDEAKLELNKSIITENYIKEKNKLLEKLTNGNLYSNMSLNELNIVIDLINSISNNIK